MILVASFSSPSLLMSRAITSRSVTMSFRRVISMLAPVLWYVTTLGHSVVWMGRLGRMVCQPGNETVWYSWLIFSHQGSCTRKISNTGSVLSVIIYIAMCMSAFDQFMFKLHSDIIGFDLACPLMGDIVGWGHLPFLCLLGRAWIVVSTLWGCFFTWSLQVIE